jgi:hypothetical protein
VGRIIKEPPKKSHKPSHQAAKQEQEQAPTADLAVHAEGPPSFSRQLRGSSFQVQLPKYQINMQPEAKPLIYIKDWYKVIVKIQN